jgi:hypothetical protein
VPTIIVKLLPMFLDNTVTHVSGPYPSAAANQAPQQTR